jgi:hypothetical protein
MANLTRLTAALLLGGAIPACMAASVACHVDYGGETRRIEARPTALPYAVPTIQIGSYFLFRLVFEQETAIKTYVYADKDDIGPVPLHQASFPWPVTNQPRHGFSGLHHVYEPVRDGELKFWCELD